MNFKKRPLAIVGGLSFLGVSVFSLKDKLTFININQDYLKYLHDCCPEVYYKPIGYDNKPYLGILINKDETQYVIPLSSAKEKHKNWKNIESDRFWYMKNMIRIQLLKKQFAKKCLMEL